AQDGAHEIGEEIAGYRRRQEVAAEHVGGAFENACLRAAAAHIVRVHRGEDTDAETAAGSTAHREDAARKTALRIVVLVAQPSESPRGPQCRADAAALRGDENDGKDLLAGVRCGRERG